MKRKGTMFGKRSKFEVGDKMECEESAYEQNKVQKHEFDINLYCNTYRVTQFM